jgi:hypothetical protein
MTVPSPTHSCGRSVPSTVCLGDQPRIGGQIVKGVMRCRDTQVCLSRWSNWWIVCLGRLHLPGDHADARRHIPIG